VHERLLAAAEELFYSQGIASTGVDAVIERAGVATGSLYKHFAGKDALVEAYLRDRDQRWREHWEACIAEQGDPVERVLAIFTALSRWSPPTPANRGCAHFAATVQLSPDHPGFRAAREHKQHLSRRLAELCAQTAAANPTDVARDLLLLYEGATNFNALDPGSDAIDRAQRVARQRLERDEAGLTRPATTNAAR
jgi:AcrR family transcriptional regulator